MHHDAREEAGRWLAQARDDLDTARRLREIDIHYASCFFAQQSAEKALKAVLYYMGAARVFGHSVAELAEKIAEKNSGFSSLAAELAPLDLYYIPTRYPNGLAGGSASRVFTREDSERALRLAEKAFAKSRRKIGG